MPFYIEGIIWYIFLLDAIIYNVMCWGKKLHHQQSHWLSDYLPLEKGFGIFYFFLVLWTGYTLYRMQIITFI